jgi:hypothetical protein
MAEEQKGMQPYKLPTLEDLCKDVDIAYKDDKLNKLLNEPIPQNWIKLHPFVNIKKNDGSSAPLKYIPIDKVKYMLTSIFQEWKHEIVDYKVLFQSVAVHVRLHYKHPPTGEWLFHDGIGSVGVQTDKGKAASDLAAIKQDAIMKALPAAASYALKNAAEKLGSIFGGYLNKEDTIPFVGKYSSMDVEEELNDLFDENMNMLDPSDQTRIQEIIDKKEVSSYKKAVQLIKDKLNQKP